MPRKGQTATALAAVGMAALIAPVVVGMTSWRVVRAQN